MGKSEEKMMYRIIAQTKENNHGITITAETSNEVTHNEAIEIAKKDVLLSGVLEDRYTPFIIQPIASKERWDNLSINFCPRCGKSLSDMEMEQNETFECFDCGTYMEVNIIESFKD